MITDENIKEIINKQEIQDVEKLDVIIKFIFDMKNVDVKSINRPQDGINYMLMEQAFGISKQYYLNKFNEVNNSEN